MDVQRVAPSPGLPPDLLHCYYGLCGLALIGTEGFEGLDVRIGLTHRSASRLTLAPP
jgi:prenyltransferase beta subunit